MTLMFFALFQRARDAARPLESETISLSAVSLHCVKPHATLDQESW